MRQKSEMRCIFRAMITAAGLVVAASTVTAAHAATAQSTLDSIFIVPSATITFSGAAASAQAEFFNVNPDADSSSGNATSPLTANLTDPSTGSSAVAAYAPPATSPILSAEASAGVGSGQGALAQTDGLLFFESTAAGSIGLSGAYSLFTHSPTAAAFAVSQVFARVTFQGATIYDMNQVRFQISPSAPELVNGSFNDLINIPGIGAGNVHFFTMANTFQPAAIPEPSTYALMLAGIGIVGFVARRRRKSQ